MKLNRNFQRGGEVLEKIPSVGEVWIFSGATHCEKEKRYKMVRPILVAGYSSSLYYISYLGKSISCGCAVILSGYLVR